MVLTCCVHAHAGDPPKLAHVLNPRPSRLREAPGIKGEGASGPNKNNKNWWQRMLGRISEGAPERSKSARRRTGGSGPPSSSHPSQSVAMACCTARLAGDASNTAVVPVRSTPAVLKVEENACCLCACTPHGPVSERGRATGRMIRPGAQHPSVAPTSAPNRPWRGCSGALRALRAENEDKNMAEGLPKAPSLPLSPQGGTSNIAAFPLPAQPALALLVVPVGDDDRLIRARDALASALRRLSRARAALAAAQHPPDAHEGTHDGNADESPRLHDHCLHNAPLHALEGPHLILARIAPVSELARAFASADTPDAALRQLIPPPPRDHAAPPTHGAPSERDGAEQSAASGTTARDRDIQTEKGSELGREKTLRDEGSWTQDTEQDQYLESYLTAHQDVHIAIAHLATALRQSWEAYNNTIRDLKSRHLAHLERKRWRAQIRAIRRERREKRPHHVPFPPPPPPRTPRGAIPPKPPPWSRALYRIIAPAATSPPRTGFPTENRKAEVDVRTSEPLVWPVAPMATDTPSDKHEPFIWATLPTHDHSGSSQSTTPTAGEGAHGANKRRGMSRTKFSLDLQPVHIFPSAKSPIVTSANDQTGQAPINEPSRRRSSHSSLFSSSEQHSDPDPAMDPLPESDQSKMQASPEPQNVTTSRSQVELPAQRQVPISAPPGTPSALRSLDVLLISFAQDFLHGQTRVHASAPAVPLPWAKGILLDSCPGVGTGKGLFLLQSGVNLTSTTLFLRLHVFALHGQRMSMVSYRNPQRPQESQNGHKVSSSPSPASWPRPPTLRLADITAALMARDPTDIFTDGNQPQSQNHDDTPTQPRAHYSAQRTDESDHRLRTCWPLPMPICGQALIHLYQIWPLLGSWPRAECGFGYNAKARLVLGASFNSSPQDAVHAQTNPSPNLMSDARPLPAPWSAPEAGSDHSSPIDSRTTTLLNLWKQAHSSLLALKSLLLDTLDLDQHSGLIRNLNTDWERGRFVLLRTRLPSGKCYKPHSSRIFQSGSTAWPRKSRELLTSNFLSVQMIRRITNYPPPGFISSHSQMHALIGTRREVQMSRTARTSAQKRLKVCINEKMERDPSFFSGQLV